MDCIQYTVRCFLLMQPVREPTSVVVQKETCRWKNNPIHYIMLRRVASMGRLLEVAVAIIILSLTLPPVAEAATTVTVPSGTKVPIRFLEAVDSDTAKAGQRLRFRVSEDVVVGRRVVIRYNTPAQGIIDAVNPPGTLGKNARVHISSIRTTAVDGRSVGLRPVEISPEGLRQAKDTGGAVATGTAGLILLGPVGIVAAVLVRGGHVSIPAGTVGVAFTAAPTRVRAR